MGCGSGLLGRPARRRLGRSGLLRRGLPGRSGLRGRGLRRGRLLRRSRLGRLRARSWSRPPWSSWPSWRASLLAGAALAVLVAAAFVGSRPVLAGAALAGAALAVLVAADLAVDVARLAAVLVAPAAAVVAFTAAPADARPPAAAAFGSRRGSATTFLNAVPALNFGTVVFLIFTVSPVRGLRPVRAPRATFWKVPNPVMPTFPPLATSRMMTSRTASSASLAAFLLPSLDSRAPMSSALFTFYPPKACGSGSRPTLTRPDRFRLPADVRRCQRGSPSPNVLIPLSRNRFGVERQVRRIPCAPPVTRRGPDPSATVDGATPPEISNTRCGTTISGLSTGTSTRFRPRQVADFESWCADWRPGQDEAKVLSAATRPFGVSTGSVVGFHAGRVCSNVVMSASWRSVRPMSSSPSSSRQRV